MLVRTVAPAIQPINQLVLQEVQVAHLHNNIPLFYLNAGQQPVMRLEFIFNAGKWFENRPGLSYFTGKMLTEGTKRNTSGEISAFFDALGAYVEVTPGFDRISLTVHLLTRHLATLLPLVSELINQPAFRGTELKNIKQIKKQRLLVDLQKTDFVASQKFTQQVFGEEHPYGKLLDVENIDSIKVEMISRFYEEQLKGNFEIILSGNIQEQDIKSINDIFGQEPKLEKKPLEVPAYHYEPSYLLVEKEDSLQSSVRLGMPFINRSHPDYIEMLVVNEILGGYFGSRLMRNIREDKGYTYGIRSAITCLNHGSLWVVGTDVKKEFRDQTLDEIIREIRILQNEAVPAEELETVKNYMLGTFISETDTPFALADRFKTIHYSGLDYDYYQRYFVAIREINQDRIQELAQKHLKLENLSKVVVG